MLHSPTWDKGKKGVGRGGELVVIVDMGRVVVLLLLLQLRHDDDGVALFLCLCHHQSDPGH